MGARSFAAHLARQRCRRTSAPPKATTAQPCRVTIDKPPEPPCASAQIAAFELGQGEPGIELDGAGGVQQQRFFDGGAHVDGVLLRG